jgi:hypothetical protein
MSAPESQREGGVEFEEWAEALRGEFDDFLRQTWRAMNAACAITLVSVLR